MAIPPARERLARRASRPAGIACGAITGLTAQMQNLLVRVALLHAALGSSKIKDVESKYPGPPPLRLPRPGRHHRRQPQHDPGHRPARRPGPGDPDPRLRRRHHRPEMGHPGRGQEVRPDLDPLAGARRRRGGSRRSCKSHGPAPAEGLLAELAGPCQLDGRDDGGLSPGLSRVFRRSAGPRHRPDRLGRPVLDPDRRHPGRGARCRPATTASSSPRTRKARTTPRSSRPPT